jgi:DNA invertase Pin-like site-specific DNA recombinase
MLSDTERARLSDILFNIDLANSFAGCFDYGRLMLTVLGGLAEFERELIRARTSEGRERAKARGVTMGRRPKLTDHQRKEAIKRRERGTETVAEIAALTT